MKSGTFHISEFEPKLFELAGLQGFSPDLHQCLVNLGLRQDVVRILDTEFTVNMGFLCTSLTITATNNAVDSDWRFSQFGIIYIVDNRESFLVRSLKDETFIFNHTEFSLLISILACRENILGALLNGFKNPFRMSLFYQNLLLYCLNSIERCYVDSKKVMLFLDEHKRKEYSDHELFFDKYLATEVN